MERHRGGCARAARRAAAVAAGAIAGGLLRAAQAGLAGGDPRATLAVNLVGAALLGALLPVVVAREARAPWLRPLLGVGLCGAYTTLSALAGEVAGLARAGRAGAALGLALGSAAAGPLAAAAAGRLARRAPWLAGALLGAPLAALAAGLAGAAPWAAPTALGAVAVAGGAATGALWRDAAGAFAHARGWTRFPGSTLAVNLAGALASGLLAGRLAGEARLLVVTGVLGGLTTFSTYAVDVDRLLGEGRPRAALAYAAATIGGGTALAALGGLAGG